MEDAFFRASSVEDVERIKAVSYAFRPKQQRVVSVDEENDELEYMESCAVPCAARSSVKAIPVSTAAQSTLVSTTSTDATSRGGAATALRSLLFWESMVCGAVSRSIAQTVMHPANTMKTILQSSRGSTGPTIASLMKPESFQRLTQGAGANFILSVPHGAINFAVLELVRRKLAVAVEETPFLKERADSMSASLDFLSSAISTITCSIVSTPQMMITGMLFLYICHVGVIDGVVHYSWSTYCEYECITSPDHLSHTVSSFSYTPHSRQYHGWQLSESTHGDFRIGQESGNRRLLLWLVAWAGRKDSFLCAHVDHLSAAQRGSEQVVGSTQQQYRK